MEKRADWIKEIYVDQADNSNKLKAQTDGNLYGNAVISKYKLQKIILQLFGGFLCGLQI